MISQISRVDVDHLHLKGSIRILAKDLVLRPDQSLGLESSELDPTDFLSEVFSKPLERKNIHIVVTVPPAEPNLPSEPEFDLNCSVLEGDGRVFSVKIQKSGTVDGLKKAIKEEKKHAFHKVDADLIDLWKVQVSK